MDMMLVENDEAMTNIFSDVSIWGSRASSASEFRKNYSSEVGTFQKKFLLP